MSTESIAVEVHGYHVLVVFHSDGPTEAVPLHKIGACSEGHLELMPMVRSDAIDEAIVLRRARRKRALMVEFTRNRATCIHCGYRDPASPPADICPGCGNPRSSRCC